MSADGGGIPHAVANGDTKSIPRQAFLGDPDNIVPYVVVVVFTPAGPKVAIPKLVYLLPFGMYCRRHCAR